MYNISDRGLKRTTFRTGTSIGSRKYEYRHGYRQTRYLLDTYHTAGARPHAGKTPMNYHRDPIMDAAIIIIGMRKIVLKQAGAIVKVGRL